MCHAHGEGFRCSSTGLVGFSFGLKNGCDVDLQLDHNADLGLSDGVLEEAVDVQVRGYSAQRLVAA